MRKIKINKIVDSVKKAFMDASIILPKEQFDKLKSVSNDKKTKYAMDMILQNCDIARREKLPLCQDTGMAEVFMFVGQDVFIDYSSSKYKNFEDAINTGVADAYKDAYLRKSVVTPLSRKNNNKNIPAIIHTEYIKGDKIKIIAVPKGFGCENMSMLKMFNPTVSLDEIVDFIVDRIKTAGPNPCPPVTLGVGIGGTSEKAMLLAKMALSRIKKDVTEKENKKMIEYIRKKVLEKTKNLEIGPLGFGGKNTVLDIIINSYPTHIAGLPCAIAISCWCNRYVKLEVL